METGNSKVKAFALMRVAAPITATFLMLALLFASCKHKAENDGGGKPPDPKPTYAITFNVESGKGTLNAKVGNDKINSGDMVEKDKTIAFQAEPAKNYKVKEWKVDDEVVTGNTSKTYTHTVTKAVTVTVSFEANIVEGSAVLNLSLNNLLITVKAVTSDGSAIEVEGCNEMTLESGVYTQLHANDATVILNMQGSATLQELECSGNKLTAVSVKGCSSLQKLNCSTNKLTVLNVQGCTALQELDCHYNQLTDLNVQGLTALQTLWCSRNKLSSLNTQGLTALQRLECADNQLTELNVQGLTALQQLHCSSNQLTALDAKNLSALQKLSCSSNQLTTLGVQGLTTLQWLYCSGNKLTALEVQGYTALQELNCHYNQLTILNISGCSALKKLYCYLNQLNSEKMTELLKALPDRIVDDGAEAELYTEMTHLDEGNCKDFATTSELKTAFEGAKGKNWNLKKQETGGNWVDIQVVTMHAVTFSVDGGNGTLKVAAEGLSETDESPISVEEGKEITFTAKANEGYKVKEWNLDGTTIAEAGTKTEYKHTVTQPFTITVSFELIPTHAVTFNVDGGNGTLKVAAEGLSETDESPISVEEGKEVTFTAKANDGYKIKEWKLDDTVIAEVGIKTEYKHTVTQPCTITVNFELIPTEKAILTLDANNLNIKVKVKTRDGSAIVVEGCDEATLESSDAYTELHAKGTTVTLLGYITTLDCSNNELTSLDVQGLTTLKELDCKGNKLTSLNVQNLASLQNLVCYSNKLTELKLQGCASLQKLTCNNNQLTALDMQGFASLQQLQCSNNQLATLDMQGCTSLQQFKCFKNQLTSLLGMQDCASLKRLQCSNNQLTALNVQGCTSLQTLECENNQLTDLNLSGCSALTELFCYSNKLTAEAFTKLFTDLPAIDDGAEARLYTEKEEEGNCKNFTTPETLKTAFKNAVNVKNWEMKKQNTAGKWVEIRL